MTRGQVLYPLARLPGLLPGGRGEFVVLGLGEGRGFGGAQGRVLLAGVAAAEFGVGVGGEVALGAGDDVPVGAVGHGLGKHDHALPVDVVQGLVTGRELPLPVGVLVVAAIAGRCGLGGGADGGQAGVLGAGADLAELVADPPRHPGGLDGVGAGTGRGPCGELPSRR